MKIVFLVEQLINSGPENVVFNICSCLDRSNYQPVVFSLRRKSERNSIESKFDSLSIDIVHFNFSTIDLELKTKKVSKEIEKKYIEVGGDLLHVHCYHPQLIAQYLKKCRTMVTLHNISGEDFILKKGKVFGHYMKWRYDRALSHIDCVVAISDYMQLYYSEMCRNIYKVPNGVHYRKDDSFDSLSFRNTLGIGPDKKVILVTGTLSERKNVGFLLSEIKQSDKDFICFILGEGNKTDECKAIVEGDNRFRFEGFKNNVQDYLNIADLYISASQSEGLPMSVLEALNMGVPCLLSSIPPHKEIQSNMNVKGVDCFNLKNGALLEIFDKQYSLQFDNSTIAEKANSLYSANAMATQYELLYDDLKKIE